MENNIVVLAFSGGLDTSYCGKYLQEEMGLEVHSVIVNTGGFSEKELAGIESRAKLLGTSRHVAIDCTQEFYEKGIRYLVWGNVLRNGNYPLSVSAERFFQAKAIAEYARKTGAKYIAHGSTGAGNDQVRFDMVFQILCPGVEIITPIRDKRLSRKEEVEYLQSHGIPFSSKKAKYSINKGLWGTSVGGSETLTSHLGLPEGAWPGQLTKKGSQEVALHFEKGELTGLDGEKMPPVEAIRKLETMASAYAIGRDVHVGDTIVGIKGRVGFEAAAASIIIKAHHLLEKHTLTKWQLQIKQQLSDWYGMFFHEGQYLDPVMRNIEAFLRNSQQTVSGKVFVRLLPYRFVPTGIESPNDLMRPEFAQYGEDNKAWNAVDAKGFIKITGNQMKLWHTVNKRVDKS
ncbi:MAG: argininosuccinate synthase [Saprospiraceae bacterium]